MDRTTDTFGELLERLDAHPLPTHMYLSGQRMVDDRDQDSVSEVEALIRFRRLLRVRFAFVRLTEGREPQADMQRAVDWFTSGSEAGWA